MRRLGKAVAFMIVVAVALLGAPRAHAQRVDSTHAGVTRPLVPADTVGPPISPRRAFLYSLLLPGYGQTRLQRPNAGALFVTVELVGIAMTRSAKQDLDYAHRHAHDIIGNGFTYDSLGNPVVSDTARNRYAGDRVKARRTHLEDWIALLVFNHLFAGADAFVAAQLWDLPTEVSARPEKGGVALAASVAW